MQRIHKDRVISKSLRQYSQIPEITVSLGDRFSNLPHPQYAMWKRNGDKDQEDRDLSGWYCGGMQGQKDREEEAGLGQCCVYGAGKGEQEQTGYLDEVRGTGKGGKKYLPLLQFLQCVDNVISQDGDQRRRQDRGTCPVSITQSLRCFRPYGNLGLAEGDRKEQGR